MITEIWRVSKPGALVVVRVPFFLSTKYYSERITASRSVSGRLTITRISHTGGSGSTSGGRLVTEPITVHQLDTS